MLVLMHMNLHRYNGDSMPGLIELPSKNIEDQKFLQTSEHRDVLFSQTAKYEHQHRYRKGTDLTGFHFTPDHIYFQRHRIFTPSVLSYIYTCRS